MFELKVTSSAEATLSEQYMGVNFDTDVCEVTHVIEFQLRDEELPEILRVYASESSPEMPYDTIAFLCECVKKNVVDSEAMLEQIDNDARSFLASEALDRAA